MSRVQWERASRRALCAAFLMQLTMMPASAQVSFEPDTRAAAPATPSSPALPSSPPLPTDEPPSLTPPQLLDKSVGDLQRGNVKAAVKDDLAALQRGPLLIHGNYCGVGNRPGSVPIDALDAACMHHDACTTDGKMPSCACDDRLRTEATAIAQDPETPPDLKAMSLVTAASMVVLVCK